MKKFRFALQAVLKVKNVLRKQKQSEFSEACAALERLHAEKRRLEDGLRQCAEEYGRAIEAKMTAPQVSWYDNYSEFLKSSIAQLEPPIKAAQAKADALRTELIALMRETDTLEKLKDEQHREYLRESQKDEEKMLGDIMSYGSAVKTDDPAPELSERTEGPADTYRRLQ